MKKLVISLVIFFSCFIFNNNIKADTTCSSSDYCFSYDNETINHIMSDEIILNNIEELKQMFLNQSTYENYVIFFNGNTWHHSSNDYFLNILMYNGELEISHNSKTNDVLNFYGTDLQVYYYPYKKLFDEYNKSYGDMSLAKNYTDYYELIYTNTIVMGKDFNDNKRIYGFLIDSNKDILYKIKYSSYDKSYYFLDEERYINDGDVFPVYSQLNSNNTPIINFSSVDNIVNINDVEKIASVDLTIDYGVIDNDKYIYMYMYDDENIWNTYYLTDSTSITLNIDKNRHVIARVLDKATYEVIDTNTFTIANIDYSFNIDFISETLKDDFGNVYQTNITINYESLNRDLFDYQYISDNLEYWVSLDEDKNFITIQSRDNLNITARIVDKSNENIVYSKTYKIIQNIDKPKISFKAFNNLKYLGGGDAFNNAKTIVESVDLTIDYGLMNNDNYAYMWKYYDEDVWTTHYLLKSSIDINITKNTTIVAQVINKNTSEVVANATYTITSINTNSPNSMFDYINNQNNTNSVFSIFSNVWNSFKNNTDIYNYLMLVITTSVIILIVKSMSK